MNDKEIYKHLIEAGWVEKYRGEILKKYYRFEFNHGGGYDYFYLDRDSEDARICMDPKFSKHVANFEAIHGVMPGMSKSGDLLGMSSNMREFPQTTGRTGNNIPQFFPIAFQSSNSLKDVLKRLHQIVNALGRSTVQSLEITAPPTTPNTLRNVNSEQSLDEDIDSASKTKYPLEDIQQRAIKTRRGQPDFRKRLLAAYNNKCAFTGCGVESVLEAAHIIPHADGTDWETHNGLLLRADVHTLFDLKLLAVGDDYRIHLSRKLVGSDYDKLCGMLIHIPEANFGVPSAGNLAKHFEGFKELEASE